MGQTILLDIEITDKMIESAVYKLLEEMTADRDEAYKTIERLRGELENMRSFYEKKLQEAHAPGFGNKHRKVYPGEWEL
jgi:hypothetical protein